MTRMTLNRRKLLQLSAATLGATALPALEAAAQKGATRPTAEASQWDMYDVVLHGPSTGNPFTDVTVSATFTLGHRNVEVSGFYDGEGVYKVRLMPDSPGHWEWQSKSSDAT